MPAALVCDADSPPVWQEGAAGAGLTGLAFAFAFPKWEIGHEPPVQSPGMPSAPLQHGIEHACAPKTESSGTAPVTTANASAAARKTLAAERGFSVCRGRGRKLILRLSRPGDGQEARRVYYGKEDDGKTYAACSTSLLCVAPTSLAAR